MAGEAAAKPRIGAPAGVARDTVEQTYARLEAEGYISRAVGRGSYVRYRCDTLLGRELLATQAGQEARLAKRELSDRGRALLAVSHTPHTSRQASLTPSLADLRAFPIDSWLQWEKQALRRTASGCWGMPIRRACRSCVRRSRTICSGSGASRRRRSR